MTKSIFDYKHVKGTTAICLLNASTGEYCGRIIANWSDTPAVTVCTACVMLWSNSPINRAEKKLESGTFGDPYISHAIGTAGGYGYDKLSSAIYSALKKMKIEDKIKVEPCRGNQRNAFEDAGFKYIEIC